MPKAKGKTRRQKFGYNVNRKRLNRNARRKAAPRVECSHIRHAWDHAKSVRQNLAEMGLALDPNKAVPLRKRKVKAMEVDMEERPKELVRKPYVLNELEAEASLPEKKDNTLSRDLIDYVRYMVENHGEDYKSGKLSATLCRRVRWRWDDWPSSLRPQLSLFWAPGAGARVPGWGGHGCGGAGQIPWNQNGAHTPPLGKELSLGLRFLLPWGSWEGNNLLFSGWVVF
ncbi:nucleolar protein 16 isoform X2 [Carlito syrichta]|uniref:Nucleolar protein 16 n=1 Tax=Carlito syrichta TaxID=1868482 RepID=A0A3Q0DDL8_CARSF|nr:nucleolar protein 16 isoform X2 [Carlito syrichta]